MLTQAQKAKRMRWVKALESGEYQQARGELRDSATGGYCCLGVACDVEDTTAWWQPRIGSTYYEWMGHRTNLPDSLRSSLGMDYDDTSALMRLNDREGLSFDEIAMCIRFMTLADEEATQ